MPEFPVEWLKVFRRLSPRKMQHQSHGDQVVFQPERSWRSRGRRTLKQAITFPPSCIHAFGQFWMMITTLRFRLRPASVSSDPGGLRLEPYHREVILFSKKPALLYCSSKTAATTLARRCERVSFAFSSL